MDKLNAENKTLAFILKGPGETEVKRIPVIRIPGPSLRVKMKACGICGSDIRYYQGENPWSLHTLGRNIPSPPNIVPGHEISGVIEQDGREKRVAILAYKGCGKCRYCLSGRENICENVQHLGHGTGWPTMEYYPGGMSEEFEVWEGFAYEIPENISFEEATFLDGLAVVVHAMETAGFQEGKSVGIIGLGPIGIMAAQLANFRGASIVYGCDPQKHPVRLARNLGLTKTVQVESGEFARFMQLEKENFDIVFDTVGTPESINCALSVLDKSGVLTLLAVHGEPFPLATTALSAERKIITSANNKYKDFSEAIRILADGEIEVLPLITHRFSLLEAEKAFQVMLEKEKNDAFKIILFP